MKMTPAWVSACTRLLRQHKSFGGGERSLYSHEAELLTDEVSISGLPQILAGTDDGTRGVYRQLARDRRCSGDGLTVG